MEFFESVYDFKPNLIKPSRGISYIQKYSREAVELISKETDHPYGKSINWKTPKFIRQSTDRDVWRYYIAGFFDAEGGIDLIKKELKIYQSWNGDECPPLIDIKSFLLKFFGIETGEVSRYSNRGYYPRFVLRIKRKYSYKFIHVFPLENPWKIKRALKLIH